MKEQLITAVVVLGLFPVSSFASIDLDSVTRAAEMANHYLGASKAEENYTEHQVSVAQGNFLPHIEADAITTSGFPGSSGVLGIGGLVGSSYRSGPAVGALASATIWDFGRTLNAVRSAEHLSLAQKAQTELTRQDVDAGAAQLFFDCVRFRTQRDAWSFMNSEAAIISKEVEKFVKTGQRSVVEHYLSRAQLEEAVTHLQDYQARLLGSQERLQVYTKLPLEQLDCPALDQLTSKAPAENSSTEKNPLLVKANENARAAEAQVSAAKDDFLPVIKGFAAVGAMESSRLVPKNDYAVGLGVQLPLFDGFKTINQVEAAEAQLLNREELVRASRDQIDLTNVRYDQIINSARVRLNHLQQELAIADEGFKVAKHRYFSFQGSLVDLREALRNLMRTRSDAIDAQVDLSVAQTAKEIFNR